MEVTVEPENRYSDVELTLTPNNKQSTFNLGNFKFDLSSTPQDVSLFGYNYFINDGAPDLTKVQWREKPDGEARDLFDLRIYRLSSVLRKPFKEDENPVRDFARKKTYGFLKDSIIENYTFLIDNFPPGTPKHEAGQNGRLFFETPGKWEAFKQYSDHWTDNLLSFLTFGWSPPNNSILDTERLYWTPPAKGIAPSELGSPNKIDWDIILKIDSTDDWEAFLDAPSIDNLNLFVEQVGIEVEYNPNPDTKLTLSTYAIEPIRFSDSNFHFQTPDVGLETQFSIKNIPIFPNDATFSIQLKTRIQTANGSGNFSLPASGVFFQFTTPIPLP